MWKQARDSMDATTPDHRMGYRGSMGADRDAYSDDNLPPYAEKSGFAGGAYSSSMPAGSERAASRVRAMRAGNRSHPVPLLPGPGEFEPWVKFFLDNSVNKVVSVGQDPRIKLLKDKEKIIFSPNTRLRVVHITRVGSGARSMLCTGESSIATMLEEGFDCDSVRIVMVSQNDSLSPLNATRRCLFNIMTAMKVSPHFLDVLTKFGGQEAINEAGLSTHSFLDLGGVVFDFSYRIGYIERNGRIDGRDPWSLRHIGYFHRHEQVGRYQRNNCILLSVGPKASSPYQQKLEMIAEDVGVHGQMTAFTRQPLNIHLLLLQTYIPNWDLYLQDISARLMSIKKELIPDDINQVTKNTIKARTIDSLRNLQDELLFRAGMCVTNTIETVALLGRANKALADKEVITAYEAKRMDEELHNLESLLKTQQRSVNTLDKRIDSAIGQMSNMLELRIQKIETDMRTEMGKEIEKMRDITKLGLLFPLSTWATNLFSTCFSAMDMATRTSHGDVLWPIVITLGLGCSPIVICGFTAGLKYLRGLAVAGYEAISRSVARSLSTPEEEYSTYEWQECF